MINDARSSAPDGGDGAPYRPVEERPCMDCGCPNRVHDDGHNEDGSHRIVATCYGAQAGYPCIVDVWHPYRPSPPAQVP